MKTHKKRTNITLSEPIANALAALATLQGRTLSELLEELGREILREHGCLPSVTPEELQKAIDARTKKK